MLTFVNNLKALAIKFQKNTLYKCIDLLGML